MRLTPVFTSGKLKEMFSFISGCANNLEQYVEKLADRNEIMECRELTAKYTIDVIGACVFGIEIKALSGEDTEFYQMGRNIFSTTWYNMILFRIVQFLPWLFAIISNFLPYKKDTKFFMRLFAETVNYRENHNIVRHDFVDVLRELKKNPNKIGNISKY